MVNINQCLSIKNHKNPHVQCPFRKKTGDFCGKHSGSKPTLYSPSLLPIANSIIETTNPNDPNDPKTKNKSKKIIIKKIKPATATNTETNITNTQSVINKKKIEQPEYYDDLVFLQKCEIDQIDYNKLIKTYRKLKIDICGNNKQTLIKELIKQLTDLNDVSEAYKNLKLCNNEEDFCDFTALSEIERKYLFIFKCQDGYIYGVDIRSLNEYWKQIQFDSKSLGRTPILNNPYNRYPLSSLFFSKFNEMISGLNNSELTEKFDQKMSEEETNRKLIYDIFHVVTLHGYSVNINDYLTLDKYEFIKLYKHLYTIWKIIKKDDKLELCPDPNLFNNSEFLQMLDNDLLHVSMLVNSKIFKLLTSPTNYSNCSTAVHFFTQALECVYNNTNILGILY